MTTRAQRYLAIYAGALTLVFALTVLTGAAQLRRSAFEEIDVQRINLREPDGTLRMVVASEGRFPGALFGKREYAHPRNSAGMIFLNDEGIENGGLIFSGRKRPDGGIESDGHLSFDPYDRDQVLVLDQSEEDGRIRAGLTVNDTGSGSIEQAFREQQRIEALPDAERAAAREAFVRRYGQLRTRVFVGKDRAQASVLALKDAAGRTRLQLQVTPAGDARIEFLDADGKVLSSLVPERRARR